MKGHGEKRTRKEQTFIAALLTAPSIEQAAKQAGIGTGTAWRWMQGPEFKTAYREARRSVVDHAIVLLQQCCTHAVGTLIRVMQDPEASASAKVMAARTVLEMSLRAVEIEQFEEALATLEAP